MCAMLKRPLTIKYDIVSCIDRVISMIEEWPPLIYCFTIRPMLKRTIARHKTMGSNLSNLEDLDVETL